MGSRVLLLVAKKLEADVVNCLILGFGLYLLVSYAKLTNVKFYNVHKL